MDLLNLLSDYDVLKNLVLESSSLKPWWWRRRGLAQLVKETVAKYQGEYSEIVGSIFFTRLQFQDFTLYNYVVREEFDVTTPGHQLACVSFVVYTLQRWSGQERRFSQGYMLDALCFPLWQRVKEEKQWQTRRRTRVVRYGRRNALTPPSGGFSPQPHSIPLPFSGCRPTEPLLPSFRLSREVDRDQVPSPLPALVLRQGPPKEIQQLQQQQHQSQSRPTVMIPISSSQSSIPGGETSTCSTIQCPSQSSQSQEQLPPPPLPPKQSRYSTEGRPLSMVLEEEEPESSSGLTTRSSSTSSLLSHRGDGNNSNHLPCDPEESSPRERAAPKCRRALQL